MDHPTKKSGGVKRPKAGSRNAYASDFQYGQFSTGPQLFNDTSGGYSQPYPQNVNQSGWEQQYPPPVSSFVGQQFMSEPMAAMAMHYSQTLADQGKVMVEEKDWAVHFNNQNEPVAPRYDVNSPDLYIPTMAFVTYILTAGYILGSQNRFSPEQLGMQASSALGWSMVEILLLFLALYVLSASSSLKIFDLIAFCSYKYVCMVAALLACVCFELIGYYAVLGYCSLSLGFFLIRTLRVLILPRTDTYSSSNRNSSYLLLAICVLQPVLMYVLTKHLIAYPLDK